jgi:branched-chain amino acid transport system permease protein
MGLLGAMNGVMVRYLDIGSLGIGITLAAMAGLILGGTARVWGAVVGVILTVGLFDIVIQSYVPFPREWYTQAIPVLREAVFGLTLILVLMFRPLGLLGDMRRDKLMGKIHGR